MWECRLLKKLLNVAHLLNFQSLDEGEKLSCQVCFCFFIQSMGIEGEEKAMHLVPGLYYCPGTRCIAFSSASIDIDCIKNQKHKPWYIPNVPDCAQKLNKKPSDRQKKCPFLINFGPPRTGTRP